MQPPTPTVLPPAATEGAVEAVVTPSTTTRPLPEPVIEPQMLLDPERLMQISLGLAAAALIVGLVLLLRLWWKQRQRTEVAPARPTAAAPPSQPRASRLTTRMRRIYTEVTGHGDYRRGGHDLARLLRNELADRLPTSAPLALTAEQLASQTEADVAGLARKLRTARFSRRPPNRQKFTQLCESTLQVLEGERAVATFRKAVDSATAGGSGDSNGAAGPGGSPKAKRRSRKSRTRHDKSHNDEAAS